MENALPCWHQHMDHAVPTRCSVPSSDTRARTAHSVPSATTWETARLAEVYLEVAQPVSGESSRSPWLLRPMGTTSRRCRLDRCPGCGERTYVPDWNRWTFMRVLRMMSD
jgi:hypothetical protein